MKQEHNELLTQTSQGTAMGEVFRRYWLPALLSEQLPSPDCPPVRLALLSEKMVAFRDTSGQLGLVDEFCAHRGVSLWFGRSEEGGLRCPYHGWKYNVQGECIDIPSERDSGFCKNIRLKSYPLIELGGVIWVYMGAPERQPPLPSFEFATVPTSQSYSSKRLQECNWLQALEGGIDSSHVSFLHSGSLDRDPLFKGAKGNQYNKSDLSPVFEVAPAPGGLYVGVRRNAEDDQYYWRITPWIMPNFTMVPPRGDHPIHGHFWVPIDDENCWAWSFDYHPTRALTAHERQSMMDGAGIHVKVDKDYKPLQRKENDYLMDRDAQRKGIFFSGIEGIGMQDASLQESMGAIQNRTRENLVATDGGIVMTRNRLIKAAQALAADPDFQLPGLLPEHQQIRSVAMLLKRDAKFQDAAKDALRAESGKPHTTV
jgi:phthalate 4,5-dioxygenase